MALTDAGNMQSLSDALGAADANLQAALNAGTSTTAAAKMAVARGIIHDDMSDADLDAALVLLGVARTAEKGIQARVDPTFTAVAVGLEAYSKAVTTNKFRVTFATGVTWADTFRALWRRANSEELIVRLGSLTNTGGTWGAYTADKTIVLDTAVQVVAGTTIGAAIVTVNLTFLKSTGVTTLVTLTIPANTAAGTVFAVSGTFVSVQSAAVSGGTSGDRVDVFIK